MRKIRRAAWRASRGIFAVAAAVAFILLYPFGAIVNALEDPKIMTDAEKREYYGYSRKD